MGEGQREGDTESETGCIGFILFNVPSRAVVKVRPIAPYADEQTEVQRDSLTLSGSRSPSVSPRTRIPVCLLPNLPLLTPALCSSETYQPSWEDAHHRCSGQVGNVVCFCKKFSRGSTDRIKHTRIQSKSSVSVVPWG